MLTEYQRKKLPNLFKLYDADGNGFIEAGDFDAMHALFCQVAGWEKGSKAYELFKKGLSVRWERIRTHADTNRDDRVSLAEWLAYVDKMLQSEEAYDIEVKAIGGMTFLAFDPNLDGRLSLPEFKNWHRALRLNPGQAEALFYRLDLNQDGSISIDELLGLVRQFFTSDNPTDPGNGLFGPV